MLNSDFQNEVQAEVVQPRETEPSARMQLTKLSINWNYQKRIRSTEFIETQRKHQPQLNS